MYYGMVHYPAIDYKLINRIRRKYDPTVDLIEPHITILFPVPESIGEQALIHHIKYVLKNHKPFPLHICGFRKSWDHWLLLTLAEGNLEVINLYRETYTGILAKYGRKDLEFIPHISLGLFVKEGVHYDFNNPQHLEFDEQRYKEALQEAEALGLDFKCVIDKVHLVKLTNYFSRIVWSKEFIL